MRPGPLSLTDLPGVYAVPPLARRDDGGRGIDFVENDRLVGHFLAGGVRRLLYGGNAFLYHVTQAEFAQLVHWMAALPADVWAIPSIGPSFGRAMDQALLLRQHAFPCAMLLPCADPRDAAGLERGAREIAQAAGLPLVLYLKEEGNLGTDREAGLQAVARLVADGTCVAIKYAVVRPDPLVDAYLDRLLTLVDRRRVISGIGERPAVAHLRDFKLPAFTTGSGCVAPRLTQALFEACQRGDWRAAEQARAAFMPLEDLRDRWGPARVLHAACDLAALARLGPIPPYVTAIDDNQRRELAPVAKALTEADHAADSGRPALQGRHGEEP